MGSESIALTWDVGSVRGAREGVTEGEGKHSKAMYIHE